MSFDLMFLQFCQKYGRRLPVGWYRKHVRPRVLWIDSVVLRLFRKYNNGPRVLWYRDHVRPRILRTAPVEGTLDATAELHVLTCARDWLNLIWS